MPCVALGLVLLNNVSVRWANEEIEAETHTARVMVEQLSGGRCRKGKLDDGFHDTHSGSIVVR